MVPAQQALISGHPANSAQYAVAIGDATRQDIGCQLAGAVMLFLQQVGRDLRDQRHGLAGAHGLGAREPVLRLLQVAQVGPEKGHGADHLEVPGIPFDGVGVSLHGLGQIPQVHVHEAFPVVAKRAVRLELPDARAGGQRRFGAGLLRVGLAPVPEDAHIVGLELQGRFDQVHAARYFTVVVQEPAVFLQGAGIARIQLERPAE